MTDEQLLCEHWTAMVRAAFGVLGDRDEAEECAGTALTQVCEQRPADVLSMEAYLVTVAKRRAIDRLRAIQRGRRRDLLLAAQQVLTNDDVAEGVTRRAEAQWMSEQARRLLSPRNYTLLRRVADGEDVTLVAQELGMTKSSAHSHLHRTRRLLRDVYAKALALLGLGWVGAKRSVPVAPAILAVAVLTAPVLTAPDAATPRPPTPQTMPAISLDVAARPVIPATQPVERPAASQHAPTSTPEPATAPSTVPSSPPVAQVQAPLGGSARLEKRREGSADEDGLLEGALACVANTTVSSTHIGC